MPEVPEMERLLDLVGVKSYAERTARELPEGQRKLVDIALALALKPRLLLMDEPTSGVASSEKLEIMDILTRALAKEKVTSVFVEHDMDMVERYANRVAVWNVGKDPESRHAGGGSGRPEGPRAGDRHMTPMLSFENVNVAIADAPVLRNVSFSLQPGVSAALIGRNGAGKTTTVRTIMGFTKANGTVRLGGEDLGPRRAAPPAVGWVSATRLRIAACSRLSPWKKTSCFPAVSQA